jgi:hypothetical protein
MTLHPTLFFFRDFEHFLLEIPFRKYACFFAGLLVILMSNQAFSQKRKQAKPNKKANAAKKPQQEKKHEQKNSEPIFFLAEIMAGKLPLINRGEFLDYQSQYYFTENPAFSINGEFPGQINCMYGASLHVGFPLSNPVIRFLSFGMSLSSSGRSLVHDISFTNTDLPQNNKISISERYSARYLCPEFQVRFGSKVYGLLGIRKELLRSGIRERILKLENDSIQSGIPLIINQKWNLKKSSVVRQSNWGYHAALGYYPIPWLGLRLGYMYTGTFFESGPDFSTHQYYLALCFLLTK